MTRKFLVPINVNGRVTATDVVDAQGGLAVVGDSNLNGPTYCLDMFNATADAFLDGPAEFGSTVLLHQDPTLALQAATKQYVDSKVVGLNEVYIGNTDPGAAYELWVDTT